MKHNLPMECLKIHSMSSGINTRKPSYNPLQGVFSVVRRLGEGCVEFVGQHNNQFVCLFSTLYKWTPLMYVYILKWFYDLKAEFHNDEITRNPSY